MDKMKSCFVIDLQDRHFVAGVMDIVGGNLHWKAEKVQIWQREETQDPVDVADLCFFRRPHEKGWKPTSISALTQLDDKYEKIPDLFEEPMERLQEIVIPALGSLFRQIISQHVELEMIIVVDTISAKECLADLTKKIDRSYRIIVAPEDTGTFVGFALLDVNNTRLPENGKTLNCTVGENIYSFRWVNDGFESVPPNKLHSESSWIRMSDLERVGLVAFDLIWSKKLVPASREQLERITRDNAVLIDLLSRMKQICAVLQEPSRSDLIVGS